MKQFMVMAGLVAVGVACGTGADMVGEILDAGVPDAGAQPGALVLPCDLERNPNSINLLRYATVSTSEVPGAFTAFKCDYVDQRGNAAKYQATGCAGVADCPLPDEWDCVKMDAFNTFLADGSYWFYCGNAASDDGYPTSIRLIR